MNDAASAKLRVQNANLRLERDWLLDEVTRLRAALASAERARDAALFDASLVRLATRRRLALRERKGP
jgi:hypothetical protein